MRLEPGKSKLETRDSSLVLRQLSPSFRKAQKAAGFLKKHWLAPPRVGIVLGSGLAGVVGGLRDAKRIAYKSIPHFPQPTVPGHPGMLHLGFWAGVPVAVLAGRMHLYEGYTPDEVVFPVRVLGLGGVEVLVLTCAAGGIAPRATPGTFMFFRDHLNLQGQNPLAGPHDPHWSTRFMDMTQAYDAKLRGLGLRAARALRVKCCEGVYAALPGPSFETPAEIQALQLLGADAVGMSTVPEVLAARQMGVKVLAIAVITNRAAGLSHRALSHEEVLEAGRHAARDLERLLAAVLPRAAPEHAAGGQRAR